MKKSVYLILTFIYFLGNVVSAQDVEKKRKVNYLVTEVSIGYIVPSKYIDSRTIGELDYAINFGIDWKLKNNSGIGLHLFANTSTDLGLRARVSQFNEEKKLFDVGLGMGWSEDNVVSGRFDMETNFYPNKTLALFLRIDRRNFSEDERTRYLIPGSVKNTQLNFGLKLNSPKTIGKIFGSAVIISGILILVILGSA